MALDEPGSLATIGGERFTGGWGGESPCRCNGRAVELAPAVCVRGALSTTLDASGEPTTYETIGDTPIED